MTTAETGPGPTRPSAAPGGHVTEPTAPARPRAAVRAFRPRRVIPAAISALALLAAGILTAVETISALAGRPARLLPYDQVSEWAATTAWQDRQALTSAGITAVLGLLLLLFALVAGRPRLVALRTGDPDLVAGVRPRTLARLLGAAASGADGVRRARTKIRGRQVVVKAATDLRDTAGVEQRVLTAVEDELGRLAPIGRYGVRARVRGPS
ncbi:DUF6286 domain-containing protein [Planotetraspora kaengkrachanensis]|uniref:DUF6286 domain-containing protein n=1 Tax=Planotetraspora kaengkrachanensis TaxID=575193 RepID=A0A8J3Q1A2_9ACTN|nr:DUF6286 domain-containing protein [Planotetraspora kaengkrachanensis]GIG84804.1 hypothetical protein Pka01_79310 [Planotetraspora kaengkrachanensis]